MERGQSPGGIELKVVRSRIWGDKEKDKRMEGGKVERRGIKEGKGLRVEGGWRTRGDRSSR